MALYRVALSACCVLAAVWLHSGESAAIAAMDDGSLRLLSLTTGHVYGYSTGIVQPKAGGWVSGQGGRWVGGWMD